MSDPDATSRPRFPFVAAALCGTCVGAAVWLFFEYSYAWDVTPHDFIEHYADPSQHPLLWRYVLIRYGPKDPDVVTVQAYGSLTRLESDPPGTTRGRVVIDDAMGSAFLCIDVTASRWTGASVAGLVVGAMGVFVFVAALRHWLGLRGAQSDLTERSP